ncbi:hypothetical protein N7539_009253 [Penicillium diatomitis]|uniref:Uncharacterized protein n=1 Tax=Penicillium diatomitis TaxID=2819901 RepID=A0A9W9WLC3_9EURO|nr:uncharacterized protein N7539_009253 [Penicillium diatomitis]KAJ5469635.1 hypothetical protein N7539_009253 [Penicillium diatomitis]
MYTVIVRLYVVDVSTTNTLSKRVRTSYIAATASCIRTGVGMEIVRVLNLRGYFPAIVVAAAAAVSALFEQ